MKRDTSLAVRSLVVVVVDISLTLCRRRPSRCRRDVIAEATPTRGERYNEEERVPDLCSVSPLPVTSAPSRCVAACTSKMSVSAT